MRSHEWSAHEGDNIIRVGISDFAQEELGDIIYIKLPKLGLVQAGDACAVVESVKTASDLHSPVSGKIVAINTEVADAPEKVNEDAYKNWLFCVKADDLSDFKQLLNATEYNKIIAE